MHPSLYPYHNKTALAFNMSQGDKMFQTLLEGLSTKEVLILRMYPELISRVQEITKMTEVQIHAELEDEYDLEIDQYNSENKWVSTEKLEDSIPDWFETSHCGWFKDTRNGEFEEWARDFLMQEVRINIWIKYLEHKKDPKPWVGSGGNYI